ncbi:G-protein coupled receptor [Homarus americanus]|uniref:G-protein coupled receptor n=1 Tax=Homarus americanus TaxID=6706 RepID=A0A8J5JIS4_HOMAM|nr:G-protein coupled receptor [Homarus americanus]
MKGTFFSGYLNTFFLSHPIGPRVPQERGDYDTTTYLPASRHNNLITMTNVSQEGASTVAAEGVEGVEGSGGVSMDVVGVSREGVVEGVLEETMSPEIQYMGHIAYSVVAPVIISFGILTNVLNLVVLTRPSLRGPTFRSSRPTRNGDNVAPFLPLRGTDATPVPYAAALYFAHIEEPTEHVLQIDYRGVWCVRSSGDAVREQKLKGTEFGENSYRCCIGMGKVPVGNALIASSVYIVVGLSIDRFVAVCYPRKYRNLHSHYVASVRIALSFVIAFIIYIPMGFYKMVVPASGSPDRFLIEGNLRVVSTQWFMVYEYLLEICVRFAPAVLLAVLNTWIIIEFKRISRRRLLLSQGMSCEVSAIPSHSYFEGNANITVVNHSPTNGQVEPESIAIEPVAINGPCVSKLSNTVNNPATSTSSSDVSPLHQEGLILNSNGYVNGMDYKVVDNTSLNGNGCKPLSADAPAATVTAPRGMSERRHDMERRLVLLLVSIIVAFFVTNIPAAILSLTFSDDKRNDLNFQIFRAIANNLEFLNFGINFILYFLFSKDIRNAFMSLLRRTIDRLKEGIEGSSSKYAATNL